MSTGAFNCLQNIGNLTVNANAIGYLDSMAPPIRNQFTLISITPRLSLKVLARMERHAGCSSLGSQMPVALTVPSIVRDPAQRSRGAQ